MSHILGVTSVAASMLVATAASASSTLVSGLALIAVIGGVVSAIYTARCRTLLTTERGAAKAWREERDAEAAKADRLELALRDAEAARHAAEARTDITRLEKLVTSQHTDLMAILGAVKDSLHAATTAVEFLSKQTFNADLGGHQ